MIERFNTLKAQISNLETLTKEEKQEFQQLLWKLEKLYIVACEDISEEDLKSIIECPDYKILDIRDMKSLLNRDLKNYHHLKKNYIYNNFKDELKFTKVENFDIGYHKKTKYIILKDSKEKIIILYTNIPLEIYKNE